ncbi:hypothetical protein SAMN04489844_2746 [Nocardioides exalbidus]|uniref:Uncharacterized protein n=1 Tax=Nocardioides exalbidus TaxID=402596 RepID=A0A1H4UEC0_9ACTN|nr:hypothetical protein [Nocardioides exalbidus]SEC66993.1 hypothetical protein SAMN04489844_2746 [Nocardioides exalbidus]
MTRTISTHHWAAAALTLVAGLGLTACGSDDSGTAEDPSAGETSISETPTETPSESTSETPTEPAGPACADVWVAGATLPEKYDGCQDAEKDKWVQAMVYHCSSGQRLVTYQRNFYAAKGEVITESEVPLARDKDFQKILTTCGA